MKGQSMKYPKMEWGTMEAIVNKLGGEEAVARFLRGELTVRESDLLRKLVTVPVKGAKKFVAKDHIKSANVGYTGTNFDKLFLDLVEENVEDANLAGHSLGRKSLDAPIMAELGDRAKIKLAHFFGLVEKQSKGEAGTLLTNGCANIAYIEGIDGNLWVVGALWVSGYGVWDVRARSVGRQRAWLAGRQVLSCDS